ncbi:MAG: PadR family transcriptional regulator [Candidatus Lambdaproteobacteria bacterium]|nr:PadR family transcriptional regulator [Candidatus Lambdaproteobacteria bacterium]
MARQNKSQYALLGMLTLGEMSGYDIKKLFDTSLRNFWGESFGQIYPILRRLVREGLATVQEESQAGKTARKVYAITPAGRAALRAWLHEPVEAPTFRLELLLKLFFGPEMPVETSRRHVQRYRDEAARTLELYEALESRLRGEQSGHPGLPYWLITLDYGRTYAAGVVAWSDRTLGLLKAQSAQDGSARTRGRPAAPADSGKRQRHGD